MVEKVGYTRPVSNAKSVRKTGGVASPGFAEALSKAEGIGEIAGIEAAAPIGGVGNIGGLIGLQEVDEREARRRQAVKRGRLTLEALSHLRDALLMGSLPLSTIEKLEKIVTQERNAGTTPALDAILDEIELRAAVEIAKLEVAGIIAPRG